MKTLELSRKDEKRVTLTKNPQADQDKEEADQHVGRHFIRGRSGFDRSSVGLQRKSPDVRDSLAWRRNQDPLDFESRGGEMTSGIMRCSSNETQAHLS